MLKTWITGTKDFTDQGLSLSEWINDNVTIVNGGKLGKCMSFNGSTSRLSTTGYELGNKWSFSCWVKDDSSVTAWQTVLGLNNNGSDSDLQMGLWLKSNESRLEFSYNGAYNSVIPYTPNQWNHFVGTYDGSSAKFYINGELKLTNANSGNLSKTNLTIGGRCSNINGGHASFANPFKGLINDVKIWDDYVLSQKEISELKKALVLHFCLDGNNGTLATPNLVHNSNKFRVGAHASGVTPSVEEDGTYKVIAESGNSNYSSSWWYEMTGIEDEFEEDDDYTVSFWIKSSDATSTTPPMIYLKSNMGYFSMNGKVTSNYSQVYYTGKWKKENSLNPHLGWSGLVGTYYISRWKLEKGTIPTLWCPNSSDDIYTALGYDDGIEYDTSGYGNNGTKIGTLSYSTDSPRYLASTYFDGDTACIRTPYDTVAWQTNFTINLWFKKNELNGNKGYETLFGGPSGFEMDTRAGNSTTLSLYMASTRGGNAYSPFNLGEWYMVTMVNDGTNELYYVNGELSKTIEKKNMPSGNYFIGAWSSETQQNYKGLISDFRIYASCLSPLDIKALYKTSGAVDSNGNFYAYEYIEN